VDIGGITQIAASPGALYLARNGSAFDPQTILKDVNMP
jgi:hypothetical protein